MSTYLKLRQPLVSKEISDCFSEEEQDELFDNANQGKIMDAILASPTPATNLEKFIDFLYAGRGDWGYPCNIEPYLKKLRSMNEGAMRAKYQADEYERLHEILYHAMYYMKHEMIDAKEALALAKKYFPGEAQSLLETKLQEKESYLFSTNKTDEEF